MYYLRILPERPARWLGRWRATVSELPIAPNRLGARRWRTRRSAVRWARRIKYATRIEVYGA